VLPKRPQNLVNRLPNLLVLLLRQSRPIQSLRLLSENRIVVLSEGGVDGGELLESGVGDGVKVGC
jgi:hypothetical protein